MQGRAESGDIRNSSAIFVRVLMVGAIGWRWLSDMVKFVANGLQNARSAVLDNPRRY